MLTIRQDFGITIESSVDCPFCFACWLANSSKDTIWEKLNAPFLTSAHLNTVSDCISDCEAIIKIIQMSPEK